MLKEALSSIGIAWNDEVPKWVDMDSVELDQYYTKPETARYCMELLGGWLEKHDVDASQAFFVEPSAGSGGILLVAARRTARRPRH